MSAREKGKRVDWEAKLDIELTFSVSVSACAALLLDEERAGLIRANKRRESGLPMSCDFAAG